jgi:Ku protein
MAAPRGTKTTLAFGLVSCPISLYKTTTSEKDPRWDTAGPNGGVLRQEAVGVAETAVGQADDSPLGESPEEAFARATEQPEATVARKLFEEGTGLQVEPEEVRRGIRREDGSFVDLTDGLEQITERTRLEEMRVADFIRVEEVRRERVTGSYYLAPDGPGAPKVVRLLFEAMRHTRRVAVVKWTKRSRQSLGVIVPDPSTKSLMVVEMCWAEDVREVPEKVLAPAQAEVSAEEIAVAVQLVQAMVSTRARSLDVQTDDARALRRELIARAEAGEHFEVAPRPEAPPEADVVEMLRASLEDPEALAAAAA